MGKFQVAVQSAIIVLSHIVVLISIEEVYGSEAMVKGRVRGGGQTYPYPVMS